MNKDMITQEAAASTVPATLETASLAISLARGEIDQQITTARTYPRSITRAVDHILTLATLDEKSAAECIYAIPRDKKMIKGPSIRLAEIIAGQWGNCRVGARVVHVDRFEKYVEAEGIFHDLETNMATASRVRRRIADSKGRLYSEDMIVVTGNAACSIAKRNAILGGVPRGVWRKTYDAVESVISGDAKTLAKRRASAIGTFASEYGVTAEQIFVALEIGGEYDIDLDRLGTLTAMRTALKNGEATVEEMFPRREPPNNSSPKGLTAQLDAIAAAGNGEPAREPPHDPETGEIVNDRAPRQSIYPSEWVKDTADPETVEVAAAAAGAISDPAATPSDKALQALMAEAHEKAKGGAAIFKKWYNRLNVADANLLAPHLDSLRECAEYADTERNRS